MTVLSELSETSSILKTRIEINPQFKLQFIDWQARMNAVVTTYPGFVSLEITSTSQNQPSSWIIVQRFDTADYLHEWQKSSDYQKLMNELKTLLASEKSDSLQETEIASPQMQGNVTEVFITRIDADKEKAYRDWMGKIHQVEATFPGFRGVYVQSPRKGRNWITLLQFDSPENLDRWLTSKEREKVLQESRSLVESIESHRVISPYAGWFASVSKDGEAPPAWKQSMIVLLVLFPIVMLELRYLSKLTAPLNMSLATFIGNALSVALIAWPTGPIAVYFLKWWLSPSGKNTFMTTVWGTALIAILYLIEIVIFWNIFR